MPVKEWPRSPDTEWTVVTASELNATHIGAEIRYRQWDIKHQVDIIVTTTLRQVSHNSGETHLNHGEYAELEVTLSHSHPVMLDPPKDFFPTETNLLNFLPEER